jgi:type VI secretion system secreted protein Hcp
MAAVDFFLKIDGIPGEASDDKHKGEIDVESWNWGAIQKGTSGVGGGAGAGKVAMHDFEFVMRHNKASPQLMLACATGKHLKTAILYARKAGGEQQEYYNIKLTDILVSSYKTGADGLAENGRIVPTDHVAFNFGKIEMEYKPQKAEGGLDAPVKTGYDVALNKAV